HDALPISVAAVVPHHGVVVGLGVLLDGVADVPEAHAGAHQGHADIEALLGNADQALGVLGHLADAEHLAGVAVIAVLDDGDIDIDDVPGLQHLLLGGDAVAYHMVDGGADGLGKPLVVEGGGDGLLDADDVLVADGVELGGGHPRHHVGTDHVQYLGGQAAGDAHLGDFVRG